jgi:corrinoid protein of di/trimethylamine methyltransferase
MEVTRTVMERFGDSDLTLESIAASLYISKSYLCRIFSRVTGESFGDYLRRVRLEQACRLLRETELTAEQIVYACGLRDIPTFYRVFKSRMGMTPNAYRQAEGLAEECIQQKTIFDFKGDTNMSIAILNEISENLQKGKAKIVAELVQKALDEGVAPDAILNEGLLAGMNIIGEKFKVNEVYVPEVLVAARAMNKGTAILKPHLAAAGVQATGKVCIGTVQGDLHDIGKNLVKMMLEGKGLEVVDLGSDVAPETFVQTAIEQNCQVICLSALLTTTMGVMEDVVKKAVEMGVRDKVKIMIGGAPVNEDFCKKIGADLYTPDAASAADAAVEFCQK